MSPRKVHIDTHHLLLTCIACIKQVQQNVRNVVNDLRSKPDRASPSFQRLSRVMSTSRKEMLALDSASEDLCRTAIAKIFPHGVGVFGEESGGSASERYLVVIDMVDGTDLVEMGIELWCSAILIHDRETGRIIASAVGMATGEVYSAHDDDQKSMVQYPDDNRYQVYGCSSVKKLESARVAYYGQKPRNFIALAAKPKFLSYLDAIQNISSAPFRIYNFAGNPLMARLCDRVKDEHGRTFTGDVDAIFDVAGQRLHDVMPGAFIAMKAGAHMFDLDTGNELSLADLGAKMKTPSSKIRYVIAATAELGRELLGLLADEKLPRPC